MKLFVNSLKLKIASGDYVENLKEFEKAEEQFQQLKEIAIKNNDEKLANAGYVFREYFLFFGNLGQYFLMLNNKEYRKSWNKLQDCIDIAKFIGRHTDLPNRIELPNIINLLMSYEKLYPYAIFTSAEYVISKSKCSICGKSKLSLDCPHITGNLYWGELATENIEEIRTIQAVAIVKNPEDKRCILEY